MKYDRNSEIHFAMQTETRLTPFVGERDDERQEDKKKIESQRKNVVRCSPAYLQRISGPTEIEDDDGRRFH